MSRNNRKGSSQGFRLSRRQLIQSAALAAGAAFIDIPAFAQSGVGATVETLYGKIRGKVNIGIHSFKGIPYGASTAGVNRFMPTVKPQPWTGVRDAFEFGHQSPQNMRFTEVLSPQADPNEGFDEDCLVLNVWTPEANDSRKRPVMFWCHGGGFAQESGSWPWIDGEALARRGDMVVVTINHRLNIFGYLHLGDIGGEKYAASGNAGMLDLVAGLEWVRDNIVQFGGDPDNVMIFGESGGGAKVCSLLAMPAAKGLFHRAAIQSGSWLRVTPREEANELARTLLNELGIHANNIDNLQKVPVAEILAASAGAMNVVPGRHGEVRLGFSPVLDGKIIPSHPFDPVATPISADIPLMVGCTQHESTLFYLPDEAAYKLDDAGLRTRIIEMLGDTDGKRAIDIYKAAHPNAGASEVFFLITSDRLMRRDVITLAERKVEQGRAPVYMYYFTWRSPAQGGRLGATHTVEIPFVFDNTHIPTVMTKAPTAKALAAKTSEAWIAFARSGDPNHAGLPNWPVYDSDRRATMVFNNTCEVISDPESAGRKFWQGV